MPTLKTKVLFLRVVPDLMRALDDIVQQRSKDNPGLHISRSSVARQLLYEAIKTSQK